MCEAHVVHSTAQSALSYLYKARLALVEALRYTYVHSGIELTVEERDDVPFEKHGSALEPLQTRHYLTKYAAWPKAASIYGGHCVAAQRPQTDPSLPGRSHFALVTTAQVPIGSVASELRPVDSGCRDPAKMGSLLAEAGSASKNSALAKTIAEFKALKPEMHKVLVGTTEIIDGTPIVPDMDSLIDEQLRMTARCGSGAFACQQLEGRWWPRICAALLAQMEEQRRLFYVAITKPRKTLLLSSFYRRSQPRTPTSSKCRGGDTGT